MQHIVTKLVSFTVLKNQTPIQYIIQKYFISTLLQQETCTYSMLAISLVYIVCVHNFSIIPSRIFTCFNWASKSCFS